MPRPRKCRRVCCLPEHDYFAPQKESEKGEIIMTVEEYETIRLIDFENFSQEECSEYMHVARTTVQQTYNDARKKLSQMLVRGCALKIAGGHYQLCDGLEEKCNCGGCKRHMCKKE